MKRWAAYAPVLAATCIVMAAWYFGRGIEHYDHVRRPLAVLGSSGAPEWRIANALLFVLPGMAMMSVAWALRTRLHGGHAWLLRMALQLGMLAALGYALQGVFNLDPAYLPDEDANRWHAVAWMLWWMAFALSALLLGAARGVPAALRIASGIAAMLVPLAMLGLLPWPVAFAHRAGIGLWLAWWFVLVLAFNRGAISAQGSSPTGRK